MSQDNVIRIMCPNLNCQRILAVPAEARGKLVRCRNCRMNVRVPLPKETAKPKDAAPPAEDAAA